MTNTFQTTAYLAPPLVVSGLSIVLLVVVLLNNWKRPTHRLLSLLIFTIGVWGVVIFLMRHSPDLEQAEFWDKIAVPLGFLVPALYWHFTVAYTGITVRRRTVAAIYLLPVVAVALAPTNLLIESMSLQSYGYSPVLGPVFFFLIPLLYMEMAAGIYNLVRAYRLSRVYSERNRLLYMIIAITFPMLGGVAELSPTTYPTTIFGNLLFCAVTAAAILRYHLLDINVIVRKGMTYLVMSALVAIPYVGIIIGVHQLLRTEGVALWLQIVLLLLMASALLPFWGRIQRLVDRWFYRERYDHLRALADFSHEAHDISDLDRLSSSLVKLISRALQTPGVRLLLPSASGDFSAISSAAEDDVQLELEARSPLLQWLKSKDGSLHYRDLDIFPQLQALSTKERAELTRIGAQLMVPLKTKGNELVGVLILGEKHSRQPYSEEDERLVYTAISRMAVELENARLYAMERRTSRQLQEQDEQKTEFLHGVAHELKTPLTAVMASSELLEQEGQLATPAQRQRLARNIFNSAVTMDRRISELLDFARMQTTGLRFQAEPLDISPVLAEVASQMAVLFDRRGQGLKVEIPHSLPQVSADKTRLEQVLINLLENANKFSPHGGSITLRARQVDGTVVVEVEDPAPFIPEEERARVFDPYYRGGDADRRQRLPGLGLGLAISKRLVEMHHGRIWVESKPGQGNVFAFSLPILKQKEDDLS